MSEKAKMRIMPLGDSITYDNDLRDVRSPRPEGERIAYRYDLYKLLSSGGFDFTFVGNRDGGYSFFGESRNAGFPGCTVRHLAEVLKTGYNGFEEPNPDVLRFNQEVDELLAGRRKSELENVLDKTRDMADRYHPNTAGYGKSAAKWFEAISLWQKEKGNA